MTEHEIQNEIREALQYTPGTFWRVNVVSGFTGPYIRNSNRTVTITKPSWISSGVPKGFPDLIGIKPVIIRENMIGETIGQFAFIEVKTEHGRLSQDQKLMLALLRSQGGIGGVARSVDEALKLIR